MDLTAMSAFIPQADELSRIQRDLRFHPCTAAAPRRFTNDQIAAFNRDGYLKPLCIFDREEIAAIRSYFDDLLARTLAAGGNSYSISTAHLRYGRVYDLLTHPLIVAYVKDLPRRKRGRVGNALFLQAAKGREACVLASGCQLLAADPFQDRYGLASHRRCVG